MWRGGGLERDGDRSVSFHGSTAGRGGKGWKLPTSLWRQFPAPFCGWAESSLFSKQCMWDGKLWLVKICWILLNPAMRWSVWFFIVFTFANVVLTGIESWPPSPAISWTALQMPFGRGLTTLTKPLEITAAVSLHFEILYQALRHQNLPHSVVLHQDHNYELSSP